MDCGSVTIDFIAAKRNENTLIAGLSNPNQINAFSYGQDVLVGSAIKANENKKAPLFERAKYIGKKETGFVFISGTASIAGEKTIGLDDIKEQTQVTIKNISDLTSGDNIKSIGVEMSKKAYTYLRVYVKREDDFDAVRKICKEKYGDIPILFIKADICRDNLLVEIEGEIQLFS
jgi:enamine deaminase RidA (YjgF/YER057c/UK114 family)